VRTVSVSVMPDDMVRAALAAAAVEEERRKGERCGALGRLCQYEHQCLE
jgi:hypothetical protein